MPRSQPAADQLAHWVFELSIDDVPEHVLARSTVHVMDTVGCAIAAARIPGIATIARDIVASPHNSDTVPALGPIGLDPDADPANSAIAIGVLMHALDFDDTHLASYMHVSGPLLAAAVPFAERAGSSGRELVAAYIAGAECSVRLGEAAGSATHLVGFHPTSVFGVVGATVAIAKLMGLSAREISSAIGIATSQASGILAYLNDGADTKLVHAGWAAHSAIWACRLARAGVTGSATAIDGKHGLFRTHLRRVPALALDDLGERWEVAKMAIKPYPVCHSAQSALRALELLMAEPGFEPAAVVGIHCEVPTEVMKAMVLEPFERKVRPSSDYECRFSLPWLIGLLLSGRAIEIAEIDARNRGDAMIERYAASVTYDVAAIPDAGELGARVTVAFEDGTTVTRTVAEPWGTPEYPLTEAETVAKFERNAGGDGGITDLRETAAWLLALGSDESPFMISDRCRLREIRSESRAQHLKHQTMRIGSDST